MILDTGAADPMSLARTLRSHGARILSYVLLVKPLSFHGFDQDWTGGPNATVCKTSQIDENACWLH